MDMPDLQEMHVFGPPSKRTCTPVFIRRPNFLVINGWICWDRITNSREFRHLEEKWHDIGLHKLVSTRQDWHAETVKQFFSTFYINPSRTLLTWMTGKNRKITLTKGFCQEVLLDPPRDNEASNHFDAEKIKDRITDTQKEEMLIEDENVNAANRIVRRTILPKNGARDELNNQTQAVLYHVLFGKPFDFIDMMFREIEKTRTDTRKFIPYAPYMHHVTD
jgi:hypothetical protein